VESVLHKRGGHFGKQNASSSWHFVFQNPNQGFFFFHSKKMKNEIKQGMCHTVALRQKKNYGNSKKLS